MRQAGFIMALSKQNIRNNKCKTKKTAEPENPKKLAAD